MEETNKQLTRIFRPKTFDEVVGQVEAKTVLKNAVANNSLLNFVILEGTMGSGKCFSEEEYVLTDKGYQQARQLRPSREAKTLPFELKVINNEGRRVQTAYYYSNGKKDCFKITTANGYEITVTPNHPLRVMTSEGISWKKADTLEKGNLLKLMFSEEHPTEDKHSKEFFKGLSYAYSKFFLENNIDYLLKLCDSHSIHLDEDSVKYLKQGVLHPDILTASRQNQVLFLQGVLYHSYTIAYEDIDIPKTPFAYSVFRTVHSELAKQLQLLFMNLGLLSKRVDNTSHYAVELHNQWYLRFIYMLRNAGTSDYDLTPFLPVNPQALFVPLVGNLEALEKACPEIGDLFVDEEAIRLFLAANPSEKIATILREIHNSYFDEIVSIEPVKSVETLDFNVPDGSSFVANGISNHNTTMARIYAKAVNCLHPVNGNPCGVCAHCKEIEEGNSTDIVEVDAASKRTIDAMRDVLKQLDYETFSLPYRVIILDEVHMMTLEAFNLLLKSLEEPNNHTIWVFATTNVEKIPDPILSRAVLLTVRRVSSAEIIEHLEGICKKMNFNFEPKALSVIARRSQGILRDSVKNLDTLASIFNGEITYKNAQTIFSVVDTQTILDFVGTVFSQDISVALSEAQAVEQMFSNSQRFLQQLYLTTLYCIKHKLHVDLESELGQDEITAITQTCKNIPTKFLWQLLKQTKDQLEHFDPQLPVLDYLVVKLKDTEIEEKLGVSEEAEQKKQEQAPQFDLNAALDDI